MHCVSQGDVKRKFSTVSSFRVLVRHYRVLLTHSSIRLLLFQAVQHKLYIRNSCNEKIQLAIRYLDPNTKKWRSRCWYHFKSGEGAYLASSGRRITTENRIWYTYAESENWVWRGSGSDARTRTCGGRSLKMKQQSYVDRDGDLYVRFTCSRRRLDGNDDVDMVPASWESFPDGFTPSRNGNMDTNQTIWLQNEEADFKDGHFNLLYQTCLPSGADDKDKTCDGDEEDGMVTKSGDETHDATDLNDTSVQLLSTVEESKVVKDGNGTSTTSSASRDMLVGGGTVFVATIAAWIATLA